MSWIDYITAFLNPIMHPLVQIHPFIAIVIVSFLVALFNAWIYKKFTDQHLMKALKDDMKRMQQEVRKYKDNTAKMMDIQSKLMKKNLDYMKQSFKPTLITMIPILMIFGWMTGHLAYDPINVNMPVNVTMQLDKSVNGTVSLDVPKGMEVIGKSSVEIPANQHTVMWTVKGTKEGQYDLNFSANGQSVVHPILITTGLDYDKITVGHSGITFVSSTVHNPWKVVLDLGFYQMGYLMSYLLCAIGFSLGIRKIMKLS